MRAFLLAAAREFTRPGRPPGCMISTAALNLAPNLGSIARFFGAVIQGMSVQARDGAGEEELAAVVDGALMAWP